MNRGSRSRKGAPEMTTPSEFLACVDRVVDTTAFSLAHTPRDRQDEWLRGFADRVSAQWREAFAPYMSAEDVDGMVADAVARVRKRRDALAAAGVGTA
jgi:hypothetical protein